MKATRLLKNFALLLIFALALVSLSGCYWASIESSEIGIETYRGQVTNILSPGGYQNFDPFTDLDIIDCSAQTLEWNDPDLVTRDKQPIGITIVASFARKRDAESIRLMWDKWREEAISDEALLRQVNNRIPSVAKTITAKYTLDQLLGTVEGDVQTQFGRGVVINDLYKLLGPELEEFGVELYDVRISNFAPDPGYLEKLKEKAGVQVDKEIAEQRTAQLQEQLKAEKAQTAVELEKASRQNKVNEELAKVYDRSDRYYELERLKLLKEVIGPTDKIYFIPQGTDLAIFLAGGPGPVPIPLTTALPTPTPEGQ